MRIIQTNAAGDGAHLIDPTTNLVTSVLKGVEIPHGVTSSPDGARLYLTNEVRHTLDVVDAKTLAITTRIPLSGQPNNVSVTKDGRKVYVGIRSGAGALDVIDTVALKNVKTVPTKGGIHNVYVTPDSRWAVAGSIPEQDDQHRRHRHRHAGADHPDVGRHPADGVHHQPGRLDQDDHRAALGLPRLRHRGLRHREGNRAGRAPGHSR